MGASFDGHDRCPPLPRLVGLVGDVAGMVEWRQPDPPAVVPMPVSITPGPMPAITTVTRRDIAVGLLVGLFAAALGLGQMANNHGPGCSAARTAIFRLSGAFLRPAQHSMP